jgi:hypothetical protein
VGGWESKTYDAISAQAVQAGRFGLGDVSRTEERCVMFDDGDADVTGIVLGP